MKLIKKDKLIKDLELCTNRIKEIAGHINTEGNIAKHKAYYSKLIGEVSQTLYFLAKDLKV
jgi:hypothetical protein